MSQGQPATGWLGGSSPQMARVPSARSLKPRTEGGPAAGNKNRTTPRRGGIGSQISPVSRRPGAEVTRSAGVQNVFGSGDGAAADHKAAVAAVPKGFRCPLTTAVMHDPVSTCDGQVYERVGIEDWFRQGHRTSPVTNLELESLTLLPQPALHAAITAFMAHPSAPREEAPNYSFGGNQPLGCNEDGLAATIALSAGGNDAAEVAQLLDGLQSMVREAENEAAVSGNASLMLTEPLDMARQLISSATTGGTGASTVAAMAMPYTPTQVDTPTQADTPYMPVSPPTPEFASATGSSTVSAPAGYSANSNSARGIEIKRSDRRRSPQRNPSQTREAREQSLTRARSVPRNSSRSPSPDARRGQGGQGGETASASGLRTASPGRDSRSSLSRPELQRGPRRSATSANTGVTPQRAFGAAAEIEPPAGGARPPIGTSSASARVSSPGRTERTSARGFSPGRTERAPAQRVGSNRTTPRQPGLPGSERQQANTGTPGTVPRSATAGRIMASSSSATAVGASHVRPQAAARAASPGATARGSPGRHTSPDRKRDPAAPVARQAQRGNAQPSSQRSPGRTAVPSSSSSARPRVPSPARSPGPAARQQRVSTTGGPPAAVSARSRGAGGKGLLSSSRSKTSLDGTATSGSVGDGAGRARRDENGGFDAATGGRRGGNEDGAVAQHVTNPGDAAINVKFTDDSGRTPLMHAAGEGDVESIRYQIRQGAVVEAIDECRCTALMYAATYGHLNAAKCLVEFAANVEATSKDGWTPLITAAYNGHLELVQYLLAQGASIEAADERGWTSLMHVAFNGDNDTLRCLLLNRARFDALDADGRTALVYASFNGHLENVRCLLTIDSAHSDPREMQTDSAKDTAMLFAAIHGHVEVVRLLLEVAAVSSETRHAALKLAADHSHHAVVELLVRQSAMELQLTQLSEPKGCPANGRTNATDW